MAGSARSVFTRLLPWAALALMTVMFLVQVKARNEAQGDAVKAKDELHALRADRAMGLDPADQALAQPRGVEEAPNAFDEAQAELGRLRKKLEAAQKGVAAARAARQDALDAGERTEALRATEAARAAALEAERDGWKSSTQEKLASLEAELAEAQKLLTRRESPVARWLVLAKGGGPDVRTVLRVETAKATSEDLQELGSHWRDATPGERDAGVVAAVLEYMPVSTASAGLAADLLLVHEHAPAATRFLPRLGKHILHPEAVARVVAGGSNEAREDIVAHAAVSERGWDAAGRARVGQALVAQLKSDDAWTLELAIRAFAQLGLEGHAGKLLPFLEHKVPDVRIATVYALLATSDRKSALRTLLPTVSGLLDEEAFDVRMAGLFLAQELAGEKRSLAFGSSDQAIAKEVARLKKKLAALAKE